MPDVLPTASVLHHEDFIPGATVQYGAATVTREDIIAFARSFDPQPIHLDEEAAKSSIVGGLCASGFHSCAIMMRLLCDGFLLRAASLGSPGIDEVKWLKPLRPGDTVSVRICVLESRVLKSRPDVGLCKMMFELVNQHSETILTAATNQLMRRRHPGPANDATPHARPAAAPLPNLWDEPAETGIAPHGNFFEDAIQFACVHLGEVKSAKR